MECQLDHRHSYVCALNIWNMHLDLYFASDLRVTKDDPEMGNSLGIIIRQHQKPKITDSTCWD